MASLSVGHVAVGGVFAKDVQTSAIVALFALLSSFAEPLYSQGARGQHIISGAFGVRLGERGKDLESKGFRAQQTNSYLRIEDEGYFSWIEAYVHPGVAQLSVPGSAPVVQIRATRNIFRATRAEEVAACSKDLSGVMANLKRRYPALIDVDPPKETGLGIVFTASAALREPGPVAAARRIIARCITDRKGISGSEIREPRYAINYLVLNYAIGPMEYQDLQSKFDRLRQQGEGARVLSEGLDLEKL